MFQVSIKEMKNFNVPLLSDHFCILMAVNDNKFTHVMFHNLHTVIHIHIHSGYVQNFGILEQCINTRRAENNTFDHMQTAYIFA